MNRKLLIIQMTTAFLLILIAISINFLTNDKSANDWLLANNIGTRTLIGAVIGIALIILVLEYFKFRNQDLSESKKEKNKSGITQTIKTGNNSQNYQAGGSINISRKDND